MEKGEESYDFIGRLALALYSQDIKMRLSTLQQILNDKGADYGGGIGMGKVVSASYRFWESKSSVTHHAIAATFTGKNDQYCYE